MSKPLARRTLLQGLGVSLTLPWLEAMVGPRALAQEAVPALPRFALFYWPMGSFHDEWKASAAPDGKVALPGFLQDALGPVREQLVWINGLSNSVAGKGDHETAAGTFLNTANMVLPGPRLAKSVDQVLSDAWAASSPIPSLVLSAPGFQQAASCCHDVEVGLNHISWRANSVPATKLQSPRDVFDKLFASGTTLEERRRAEERRRRKLSVLDFVTEDAKRLQGRLGTTDRARLDAFAQSVRETELRVAALPQPPACTAPATPASSLAFGAHNQAMFDLAALAFQCDLTRVVTFIMDFEFSDRLLPISGVTSGHHSVSHHGEDPDKVRQFRLIQAFYARRWAGFVSKLQGVQVAPGKTLLDESMVMLGSGMSDGNSHDRSKVPLVLAGRGQGKLRTPRVIDTNLPLSALFRALLRASGRPEAEIASFGAGQGELSQVLV
jgi:Protein of unknown function (DUF1552)